MLIQAGIKADFTDNQACRINAVQLLLDREEQHRFSVSFQGYSVEYKARTYEAQRAGRVAS